MGFRNFWRRGRDSNPRVVAHKLISSSCKVGSLCPSLSLISVKIKQLVTALLPLPRKMHGFLKAEGTNGHYWLYIFNIYLLTINAESDAVDKLDAQFKNSFVQPPFAVVKILVIRRKHRFDKRGVIIVLDLMNCCIVDMKERSRIIASNKKSITKEA